MWNTSGPKIRDIQITCLFVRALDWDLNFTYFCKNYFMFLHVWSMNGVWVEVRGQFINSSLPPLWVLGTDLRLEKQVTLPRDHLTGVSILFIARDQGSYEWTASSQAISQTETKTESHSSLKTVSVPFLMYQELWNWCTLNLKIKYIENMQYVPKLVFLNYQLFYFYVFFKHSKH